MNQIRDYEAFAAKQLYLSDLASGYADIMFELDDSNESEYARALSEKIKSENFEIAVVGSFKNGKSTFINALLGKEILPAYARPCTAIINEVRYGEEEAAVVFLKEKLSLEQTESLPSWIKKEIRSKGAAAGISVPMDKLKEVLTIPMGETQEGFETPYAKMVLYYPLELLKNHVIITDTPGLNEIETRTRITTDHLGRADAIIMLLAADKLCSRVEMEFVEKDLKANGFLAPFFVINRMDALRIESEKEEIKQLALAKLVPLTKKGKDGVFFLSALDALEAILDSDEMALVSSKLPMFERALADYLTKERGRDKLIPSAELILSKLGSEVLAKTLPKMRAGLKLDLQDAIIRQVEAQENLEKAAERKCKIDGIISKNSQIYIEDLSQMIDGFYSDLVDQVCLWVDNFEPQSGDELNPKKRAAEIQKQILSHVSEKIREASDIWYREKYQPAVLQKIQLLRELIQDDLAEFLRELRNSQVAFFGENSTAEEENSLVRASFSTESIVNSELTKNVGKSLGVAIGAGLVIELLTGLMNPILGIVTALGAITVGVFRSTQKMVPEIKDGIKKSVSEKLKADEGASSSKLKEEVKRIFGEYREQLLQALEQKFAQAQKDIDSIVDTLKKDKYAIDQKMAQLSQLEERTKELRQKIQNFIGDM